MRVYMTGSSGVGKTTQANLLSERLQLPVIDGIARSSPYEMGTDENQQYLSKKIYHACNTVDGLHCRTPLDVLGYTRASKLYSPTDEQHVEFFALMEPILIYFPPLGDIEDDGVRPTDKTYNKVVDWFIKDALRRYNFKYLELSPGTPEERSEEIITFIRRHYDPEGLLECRGYLSDS